MPLKYNSHDWRPFPPSFVARLLAPLARAAQLNPRRRQPVPLVVANPMPDYPKAVFRTNALTFRFSPTGPLTPRFGGDVSSPRSRPALASRFPVAASAPSAPAAQES
jgi:hypothetical protein